MTDTGKPTADAPATGTDPEKPLQPDTGGPSPQVHEHHGNSVAAWTAVAIILLGTLVMCFAVVRTSMWLFVIGAVIAVLGVVAGKVLSAMGFGVSGKPGQ